MAIELDQVVSLKETYEDAYDERHAAFRKLRRYWQGEYWQLAKEAGGSRSIATIFRDIGRHNNAPPLNVQVVHNVIQQVCVKYQTFLAPLPMIRMYVDPPESATRRRQANDKERFLYGVWTNGRMSARFREIGWYLPLMGDAFLGVYPDFGRSLPVPIIRSPEVTYPIPGYGAGLGSMNPGGGASGEDAYVFHWQERCSTLARCFPAYTAPSDRQRARSGPWPRWKRGQSVDPKDEVYEYSDSTEFGRWAGGQKLNGVEHGFGFNLFEHAKFIEVPGEVWGHGAVEQAVNLNEVENLLYSMLVAAVYENVFPSMVIKNPQSAPEEIIKGPGSVIPIGADGDVSYLTPPVQALPTQMGFIQATRRSILEASSMSEVDFGQSPVSSILTGAAVNELQGAGTGSTVEMVQGSLGMAVAAWNEKAGIIQQSLFREDDVTLYAMAPRTSLDLNPRQGVTKVRGSRLIGGWRNEIVFSPAMSQHDKLVMWLQAKGGGLVSDSFIREQIGIPDNEAMQEEIVGEEIERAVLQFVLRELTEPSQAADVEAQAIASIEGTALPTSTGAPATVAPAPGPGQIPLGGGGVASAPALPLPPGAPQSPEFPQTGAPLPPPAAPSGPTASPPGRPVPLQVAETQLAQADIDGKAWLVGEIVATGAARTVEVAITDPDDRQPLADAADFPIVFHVVNDKPQEQSVPIQAKEAAAA